MYTAKPFCNPVVYRKLNNGEKNWILFCTWYENVVLNFRTTGIYEISVLSNIIRKICQCDHTGLKAEQFLL